MHARARVLVCLILLGLPLLSLSSSVGASPDQVTRDPSWTYREGLSRWMFPTNAYTSNDQYASASIGGAKQVWQNYTFQEVLTENDTITRVEIGVEHYETQGSEELYVYTSWDAGNTWSDPAVIASLNDETMEWLDTTDLTDWTLTKLSDPNLQVKLRFMTGVGGCYADNTFFVVYDEATKSYALRSPSTIHAKDTMLVWTQDLGIHCETVLRVDQHEGTWQLMDFYSGNLTFQTSQGKVVWSKHLAVTDKHPMWNPSISQKADADSFDVGDRLTHINKGELVSLPIDRIDVDAFKGTVYSIVVADPDACLFAKSFSPEQVDFLQKYVSQWRTIGTLQNIALAIKTPYTAYVDWVPVRVTYIPSEGEAVDCNYIGINSTLAGESTSFKADFTDLNASDGLSHFRFYTNNTGSWVNDTWSDEWSGNWSITVKTLNATVDLVIAFRFFVNDTGGTEHASTICFFPTSEGTDDTTETYGAGLNFVDTIAQPTWQFWTLQQFTVEGLLITIILVLLGFIILERLVKHARKIKVYLK